MCSAKNKIRGNTLEYEVVEAFKSSGHEAERAWGSNGRALGQDEQVDCLIDKTFKIQCKRRKVLPEYFGIEELLDQKGKYDALVIRKERSQALIVMSLEKFIKRYYHV